MVRIAIEWWRYRFLQTEKIIVRNRMKKKPDIHMIITYHPKKDEYFAAAFSMNFSKDFEDDWFVLHTAREGMSQETVVLYWEAYRKSHRRGGKEDIFRFLDRQKMNGKLAESIKHCMTIADKWNDPGFGQLVISYLEDYMESTLYAYGYSSRHRLILFTEQDPILAQHIWDSNFSTPEERKSLVDALGISQKNRKKFIDACSVDKLRQMVRY